MTTDVDSAASWFGAVLRDRRVAAGLTQEELAERAQLSVRGLRYLEHGLRRPSRHTVARLGAALALSAEDRQALAMAGRVPATAMSWRAGNGGVPPVPPTPLIGREREVEAVTSQLRRRDVRLVTVTGPGGVGKTRLALEVARLLMSSAAGAVVWVPLASLTHPALVTTAIGKAFGLEQGADTSIATAIDAVLGDRRVVLLLDNFESVAAAAVVVADLIASCPRLSVFITSRSPLGIQGEHEYPLGPLPAPTVGADVHAVAANASVDLFLRRAQAGRPDMRVTPENSDTLAAICRCLDGLPLALELAAARMRSLTPQAMLERLEHRLTFLSGAAPDRPERQRTMRATIAWSYELLTEPERRLFRWMGAFAGGCTLTALEGVYPGCGPAGSDVLDGVEALHRNSLLRLEDNPDGQPRFQMLQTIRDYALERLVATSEDHTVRQRHAQYFLAYAVEVAPTAGDPAAALHLHQLEQEHNNLREALDWLAQHDTHAALRLAARLWWFWYVRGHITEGRQFLTTVLALPRQGTCAADRAEALLGAGQLAHTQGDFTAAAAALKQSLTLFREQRDDHGTAAALLAAGFVARIQQDYPHASALLHEGLDRAKSLDAPFITAATLHHLGMIAADHSHDYAAARLLLNDSLSTYRELNLPRFIALVTLSLGEVALAEGDPSTAHDLLHDSLRTLQSSGERLGLHGALDSLAELAYFQAQIPRAVRLAAAAARLRAATGTQSWPVTERRRVTWLNTAQANLGDTAFHAAWTEGETLTTEQAITIALDETALPPCKPADSPTLGKHSSASSPLSAK